MTKLIYHIIFISTFFNVLDGVQYRRSFVFCWVELELKKYIFVSGMSKFKSAPKVPLVYIIIRPMVKR